MRNHEITLSHPLLKEDGSLWEAGFAKSLLPVYRRADIKAPAFRIKEWDYYLITSSDKNVAVALTLSDLGYIGLHSVSFLDLSAPNNITKTEISPFPMGRLKMPENSSSGTSSFCSKKLKMRFDVEKGKRHMSCTYVGFDGDSDFSCDITLLQPPSDTMVIATPWKENKRAFYYNQKINCMPASGVFTVGDKRFVLDPASDFGILDWGRGVWTYDNVWYWGTGSGLADGVRFGFNLGYGFGDISAASENMIFYDGKASKIDDVVFNIPDGNGYMKQWTVTSSDGRFEAVFDPIIDRCADMNFGIIVSDQHQVFGRLTGTAVLDGGKEVKFKDFLCAIEYIHNKY